MYWNLGEKLVLPNVANYDYSQSVRMGKDNTVKMTALIYSLVGGASSVSVVLQGSNDRQNWTTIDTYSGLGVGFNQPGSTTGIPFAYVRARYTVVGGGKAVADMAICTDHL